MGNTRVLFKDAGNGTAQQIESYSYYAYGGLHQEQSDFESTYLFGGKELQADLDLGWSDFHLRCMDNWTGRFIGIDVLADSYANTSPYNYTLGNPISNIDPTGASTETYKGDEAQSIFSSLKSSYNGAVASGQKVNKNLWSSSSSSGGGVGLQVGSYNSSALSSQFSSLFGMLSGGGGDDEEKEESETEGKSWLRSAADWVPVVGSFLGLRDAYQAGDKWGMAFYSIMLVSDFFLVGTIAKGIAKGGIRALSLGNTPWSARDFWNPMSSYRTFYGNSGFAAPRQQLHHWFIHQRGPIGRFVPNGIKHQMWNLIPMPTNNPAIHQLLHGGGALMERSFIERAGIYLYHGTPTYLKTAPFSIGGRLLDE